MTDIASYYPPGPDHVPPGLTAPSGSYRARVLVVLVSLMFFLILYVALVVGSAYLAYAAFASIGARSQADRAVSLPGRRSPPSSKDSSEGLLIVAGICSGLLCLFLIKGFFKRQRADSSLRVEVTEPEQPILFAFIRQLCRDTRAPFPRRIYVTPEVNASVFYNSSFLSLFVPTRKNLMMGFGLINHLSLGEMKAVLAHEFGHFSQSSMKLGSYVYAANRIIGDIVFGRDWLDDTVAWLRRADYRIAIVAWAFTGVLWGLRKLLQGLFQVINFASSALSRQMEFNADLVAVSVTGSDMLIHGLARCDFANEALGQACHDLSAAADHGLYTRDLFYHQTRAAEYLRTQRKDTGEPPPLPADSQPIQVFQPGDSDVPLMWATHPSNYDRERNAKRHYLSCAPDERSSWLLFTDAAALREKVTRQYYATVKDLPDVPLQEPEVVQRFIDDEHAETTYHPRYHGLYDNRFIDPGDLATITDSPDDCIDPARLGEAQAALYGEELKERIETYHNRQQEYSILTGLVSGSLTLKGKDFSFRDGRYRAADARRLLAQVDKELDGDIAFLAGVDRRVLHVHLQMARHLSPELCRDLLDRYRFHLGLQSIFNLLSSHRGRAQSSLEQVAGERELSEETFAQVRDVLIEASAALRESLNTATTLPLPALKNMTAGEPLSSFLVGKPLVEPLSPKAKSLDGSWIARFMQQLEEVHEKTRRIHFKSLGGILALQQRITEQWSARNTTPVAQAIADESLAPK